MLEKQGYGRSACDWQECMLPWHHERKEKSELLDNYHLKTRSKMIGNEWRNQTLMTQCCERKRNGKSSTITRHDTKSKLHLCPNCVDIFSDFLIFTVYHITMSKFTSRPTSPTCWSHKLSDDHKIREEEKKNAKMVPRLWLSPQTRNKDHGQESNLRPSWLIGTTSKRTTTCPNLTRCATTTPPRLDTWKGPNGCSI